METTILMVSNSPVAARCAEFLSKKLGTAIEVVNNRRSALATLRRHEFAMVMVDTHLAALHPEGADLFWQHSSLAMPLLFQMPTVECGQLLREVKAAFARRDREQSLARRAVAQELEAELKSSVTGILLESELALLEPGLSASMQRRLHHLTELAGSLRNRLRVERAN